MTAKRLFEILFFIALFTMGVRETLDADMWWHLRTGEYILQEGIPRQDVFSFTVTDREWITHEWLSQVFMWQVYDIGGFPALIIVFALMIALTFWLIYRACAGRPYLAAFVVLLSAYASAIVWGARPQIFNMLLTAVFVYVVEGVKDKKFRVRWLWLLALLMPLWANLHSGYLLGVVLLGTYTVGEGTSRWLKWGDGRTLDWSQIRQLALVTVVSFLLAAFNPNGPALWVYPFLTLTSPSMQAFIQEWHSPDFHLTFFWPFGVMMAVGVLSWVFSPKRPTPTDLLLFMGTAAAGLMSARNIPLFAIVSAPIIARALLSCFTDTQVYPILSGEGLDSRPTRGLIILNVLILLLVLFGAGVWIAGKIVGNERVVTERYPVTAVDYLEETGLADAPGYNSYNWGWVFDLARSTCLCRRPCGCVW